MDAPNPGCCARTNQHLLSSHYTDELSTHLLCASANPIYVEKHAFALDPYLERPQVVKDGTVEPTDEPGTGLRFDRQALERAATC